MPTQIIVVLDRCTDGTEAQVDPLIPRCENLVKVVKHTTKYSKTFMKGFLVAEAVNAGLDRAVPFPDFVMVCNADSKYSSDYVEEALNIMHDNPHCGIVGYRHYANISGSGYIIRSSLLARTGNRIKECAAEDTYLQLAAINAGFSIESVRTASVSLMRASGDGSVRERFEYAFGKGFSSYTLGYSIVYEIGRTLYWVGRGKLSHFGIVFGFLYGILTRAEKLDIAATSAAKQWQKYRLKSIFSVTSSL